MPKHRSSLLLRRRRARSPVRGCDSRPSERAASERASQRPAGAGKVHRALLAAAATPERYRARCVPSPSSPSPPPPPSPSPSPSPSPPPPSPPPHERQAQRQEEEKKRRSSRRLARSLVAAAASAAHARARSTRSASTANVLPAAVGAAAVMHTSLRRLRARACSSGAKRRKRARSRRHKRRGGVCARARFPLLARYYSHKRRRRRPTSRSRAFISPLQEVVFLFATHKRSQKRKQKKFLTARSIKNAPHSACVRAFSARRPQFSLCAPRSQLWQREKNGGICASLPPATKLPPSSPNFKNQPDKLAPTFSTCFFSFISNVEMLLFSRLQGE